MLVDVTKKLIGLKGEEIKGDDKTLREVILVALVQGHKPDTSMEDKVIAGLLGERIAQKDEVELYQEDIDRIFDCAKEIKNWSPIILLNLYRNLKPDSKLLREDSDD